MRPTERAYLAGLLDGEAYVGITRSRTSAAAKGCKRGISYRVMLCVAMTHKPVLEYAQKLSGVGQIHKLRKAKAHHRQAWSWVVWSKQAADLLKEIRQYMLVKAEPAEACIEFQSVMRYPGKDGLTDSEWKNRERLWRKTKVRK